MKAMRLVINDAMFTEPNLFVDDCGDTSAHERYVRCDDPESVVRWPIDVSLILSPNDQAGSSLAHTEVF